MQQASGGGSQSKQSPQTSSSSLVDSAPIMPARNGTNTNITISSPPLWRPLDSPSPKSSLPSQRSSSPPPSPSPASKIGAFNFLGLQNGISSSPVKAKEPEILKTSPTSLPSTTAATNPFPFAPSLYSPFSSALPFLPPTFNLPGLSALPIHKQALLSPLLASSHFLAAARKAYPFLPTSNSGSPASDPSDVLAEHKALLERFRASAAAMAAAAALNNNTESNDKQSEGTATPPPNNGDHREARLVKKDGAPMDLSKRSSSEDSVSSVGSEIIPHLSDTDEEVDTLDHEHDEKNDNAAPKASATRKSEAEMPLDLTCV